MSLVDLKNRARQARDENQLKANTATRIGQILMDIIDYISALYINSHSHNNKTVIDQLTDSVGGLISSSGGKLQYRGQTIETSSITPSIWIDPPVLKIVSVLPLLPNDRDRYIYSPNGRIFEYDTDHWVLDSQTDPNPVEGSVVIVRYNSLDQEINHTYLYISGQWIDKDDDYNSNNQRYVTSWDGSIGRKLISIVGSPDNISSTGLYSGNDNVIGNPLHEVGIGLYTDVVYYIHLNHNSLSAHQEAYVDGNIYRRDKINSIWSEWVFSNTSGTNTGDQVGDGVTIMGTGSEADPFVVVSSLIPTNTSDLANDSGFITIDDIPTVDVLGTPLTGLTEAPTTENIEPTDTIISWAGKFKKFFNYVLNALATQPTTTTNYRTLFFSDQASTLGVGYKKLVADYNSIQEEIGILSTLLGGSIGDETVIGRWSPDNFTDPARIIPTGVWDVHFRANVDAIQGRKNASIIFKTYIRRVNGTEELLATTLASPLLAVDTVSYNLEYPYGDLSIETGEIVIIEVLGKLISGVGGNPTVQFRFANATGTRLEVPYVDSYSHNDLFGRDVAGAHPISSITGLSEILSGIRNSTQHTLTVAGWVANVQAVTITGITSLEDVIITGSTTANGILYGTAQINAVVTANTVTFTAVTTPTANIIINIKRLL